MFLRADSTRSFLAVGFRPHTQPLGRFVQQTPNHVLFWICTTMSETASISAFLVAGFHAPAAFQEIFGAACKVSAFVSLKGLDPDLEKRN